MQLTCSVGSYNITVKLEGDKLSVRAYSENPIKLFIGEFEKCQIPEDFRIFGEWKEIYELIEEGIEQKHIPILNEAGEIKFPFFIKVGKLEVTKQIPFTLKQTQFTEMQKSSIKIQKLELQVKNLKGEIDKLKELQNIKIEKSHFQIDTTTVSFNKFIYKDNQISINNQGSNLFYPLFSKNKIEKIQRFEFEVVNHGNQNFMIGVATADLKDKENNIHGSDSSVSLYKGKMYYEGKSKKFSHTWQPYNGDKIAIVVDLIDFAFWREDPPLFNPNSKVYLPAEMKNKDLFAYISICDNDGSTATIKPL